MKTGLKKIIIASDSFKGSLSAVEICDIAEREIQALDSDCEVVAIPVADGGEGTVACFLRAAEGQPVNVTVQDCFGNPIVAEYARFGDTAVVEMAAAAGLTLTAGKPDPIKASTYGVGQLIRHAIEHGAVNIILSLGGSATNDGGCGCAAALGVRFTDSDGNTFVPTGGTLSKIDSIDLSTCEHLMKNCTLTAMCDVTNPMHGNNGAAHIYAPQKGADENTVLFLNRQLEALDASITQCLGKTVAELPGAGAAGAFGAGVVAFLGGSLKSGIETVLDTVHFDEKLAGADLVITGEGKTDAQSTQGKVIYGVAVRAKKQNVPVVVLSGVVDDNIEGIYNIGITATFSISRMAIPFPESNPRSAQDYACTLRNVLQLWNSGARSKP